MSDLPNLAKQDYQGRVNRAIDYILQNLGGPLDLTDIARVACFSPYHFHRIFRGLVGETLNVFIKRVRLERAMYLMSHRDGTPLTEIALACGFSSSSDFSRSFRRQFSVSPSAFDLHAYRFSQRQQLKLERLPVGQNPDGFEVRLRDYAPRQAAYIRVMRPFEPGKVYLESKHLVAWAEKRGLENGQWLGYMWEDPEIVPLDKCRYDIAVEVPGGTQVGGDVSLIEFPVMRVAEIEVTGPIELEQRAIDYLYFTWLPQSGFAPAHHPAFEAWNGRPFAHGEAHFELRVQLPVVDGSLPL
jgi:AraC family transcriptional regulator